jgi:hypothetical protein
MKNKTRKLIARYLVAARLYMAGVVRQTLALTLSLAVAVSPAMAASNGVALPKAVGTPSHAFRNVEYLIGSTGGARQSSDDGGCHLQSAQGEIKHVIYIQFDNVHFERDNPNVPSDLEQMPHLLNFLKKNGALLTNSHTPLISHTSVDILTSLTASTEIVMALLLATALATTHFPAPARSRITSIALLHTGPTR